MRALPLLLTLAALAGPSLQAQQPEPATAAGTVFDSIRVRPLAGARVRVDSSELVAVTDANGQFLLPGIPPGPHFFRIEHPLLDTLGLVLRSETATFAAGSTTLHEFATPSQSRMIELFCTPAWRARGPAALMGRVRDAHTGAPAAGAKVSLVWYELDVTGALRRAPRVREAAVGADGSYRICGLPAQLDGKVQVLSGGATSGEIAITFGEDILALRSMSIGLPGAVASASGDSLARRDSTQGLARTTARLNGRVLNRSGSPLSGARVLLEGTTRATTTRANGEFVLDSLPPGTQSVAVRLLGYTPVEQAVDLVPRETRSVTIRLEDFVPVLEAVRVSAQRERALDDVGFQRRKRTGQGFYMDEDQIKSRNALYFSDVLRTAPSIRVVQQNGRQMLQSARDPINGCVVVWVDGTMWQQMEPGDIDDFVKPYELGAIEVYSATSTPMEYQSNRSGCTTVVAWTTRRLDRKRR